MESTLVNMVCVLVGVALIMGGILAYVNHMTEGPISLQAEKALSDGIKAVMMSDNLTITANDTVRETIDNKECVFVFVFGSCNANASVRIGHGLIDLPMDGAGVLSSIVAKYLGRSSRWGHQHIPHPYGRQGANQGLD